MPRNTLNTQLRRQTLFKELHTMKKKQIGLFNPNKVCRHHTRTLRRKQERVNKTDAEIGYQAKRNHWNSRPFSITQRLQQAPPERARVLSEHEREVPHSEIHALDTFRINYPAGRYKKQNYSDVQYRNKLCLDYNNFLRRKSEM